MSSINFVNMIGRLGVDPVFENNRVIASIATDESYLDADKNKVEVTDWHRVVFSGKAAELFASFAQKGSEVFIHGRNRTIKYEDKETGKPAYLKQIQVEKFRVLNGFKSSPGEGEADSEG